MRSKKIEQKLWKRSIWKRHGFEITIEKGLFQIDFLDIRLNLRENIYEPFRKENAIVKYINNESNHPQNIRNAVNQNQKLVQIIK